MTEADQPDLPPRRSNSSITAQHRIELAAARFLFCVFRLAGVEAASAVSGKGLRIIGPLIRSVHRRGLANLSLIYPDWSDEKKKKTLRGVWENLGRTSAEFVHLEKMRPGWEEGPMRQRLENLCAAGQITPVQVKVFSEYKPSKKPRISLDVDDNFIVNLVHRKPTIFVTGHFANWEVMSVVCDFFDIPCAIVYRASNNPLIDELIIKTRSRAVRHRHIPKGPDGIRPFLDALKEQYSLGLVMDQKFTDGVSVPFLGQPAQTASTAARLALSFNLPIVPVAVVRQAGAYFTLKVRAPLPVEKSGDLRADTERITAHINLALGEEVHEHPDQWLWFHRRWGKRL